MIIKRRKFFSQNKTLNTGAASSLGFIKGRSYDMDFNRLGRLKTTRELTRVGDLGREQRKLTSEINKGIKPQDLKD